MFTVTNKSKDVRKFRDSNSGKDVFLNPGESTFVKKPIKENSIFKVEKTKTIKKKIHTEKIEEKKELNNKEVKQNDSSSS